MLRTIFQHQDRGLRVQVILAGFLLVSGAHYADAQVELGAAKQLSLSTSNGAPNAGSGNVKLSPNGQYAVFESNAGDLVSSTSNTFVDVYLRNLNKNTTSRISVGTSGLESEADARNPAISQVLSDGFFVVAFDSNASNLVAIPLNTAGLRNVYLRLPTFEFTALISAGVGLTPADGSSEAPSVTAVERSNGSRKVSVAFSSSATNLIESGDTNGHYDIYLGEALLTGARSDSDFVPPTGTMRRLSVGLGGVQADGGSRTPQISGDGNYVVFVSDAANLIPDFPTTANRYGQIYLVNTRDLTMKLVSRAPDGAPANGFSSNPVISYDGRFVAFSTYSTNLLTTSGPSTQTILWFDLDGGRIARVNVGMNSTEPNGSPGEIAISPNGRFVAFADSSSNLVSDDTNSQTDVFVRDMEQGITYRVSRGADGSDANSFSGTPSIAATSFTAQNFQVAFQSYATNLLSNPTSSTAGDVFLVGGSFPTPELESGTPISVPPDVTVGSKRVTLRAQKFTIPAGLSAISSSPRASASNLEIRYKFEVTRRYTSGGVVRRERSRVISRKNSITVPRQSGNYTVRNLAMAVRKVTGTIRIKSGYSPRQQYTVE